MVCVKKFCCFSLRTGGIIIGIGSFVIGTTIGALGFLSVNHLEEYVKLDEVEEEEAFQVIKKALQSFIVFVVLLIDIPSILLIIGAVQGYQWLLIFWMIMAALSGAVLVPLSLILISLLPSMANDPDLLAFTVIILLITGPGIYSFVAVISLYQEIDDNFRQPRMPPENMNAVV